MLRRTIPLPRIRQRVSDPLVDGPIGNRAWIPGSGQHETQTHYSPYQPHVRGRERYEEYLLSLVSDWDSPVVIVFSHPDTSVVAKHVKAARLRLDSLGLQLSTVTQPPLKRAVYVVHAHRVTQKGYEALCSLSRRGKVSMPVVVVDRLLQASDVQPHERPISLSEWDHEQDISLSWDGGILDVINTVCPERATSEREYSRTDWYRILASLVVSRNKWRNRNMALNRKAPVVVKPVGKRGAKTIPERIEAFHAEAAGKEKEVTYATEAAAAKALTAYSEALTDLGLDGIQIGPDIFPDDETGKFGFVIARV